MVKKSGRMSSTSLRSGAAMPMLMMECWDESLSPVQIAAYKEKVLECQRSQEKVREAHRLAQLGKAIVTVLDDPRKRVPPLTLQQLSPDVIQGAQAPRSTPQEPPRSTSPDIIFIGESPPVQKTPPAPPTEVAQARAPLSHFPAVPRQLVQTVQMPGIQLQRFPPHQPQTTALQIQGGSIIIPQRANIPQTLQQLTPVDGTYGIGVKRALPQQLEDTSPKRKRVETDNQGNWVPLDEFYYGKMEGDPTYSEEKNEFRFKCWYCNKMLYNNIKAMMHIQGHIDSSKQQNIDLSDLTQCKHCYRQFDTPFEMQTHVEKVHMNNVNVLMCRICERDHQSRQALMTHMRVNHNACEMPYICQLCKFRSSMYSDVVDHFKKKHDSSQHILCLYCLKVFAVKFVSQGWGQTQTYYGHLLKHQSKSNSKKCTFCRLTFVNPADCKTHKKKDHVANQKGIDSRPSVYGQDMMIKVPESGLASKQALKSLNAPTVSKVLDFGGTRFPYAVNFNSCVECKTVMGTPDHFRKHIECSMCRFATSCSIAYANHMMGFHSGQMSSLNLNIPWERPMKEPMHCLCGFVSRYGNKIANHLVYCTKRSCYSTKPAPVVRETEAQEDVDPRYKPGASLLDALGLVKKKNVSTKDREVQRRRSSEEPSELIWKSSKDTEAPPTEEENQEKDEIPEELKGAEKWKTVKIKDPSTPSKASVFLGEASEPSKDLDVSRESREDITLAEGSLIEKEGHASSSDQSQSEQSKQEEDGTVSIDQSKEEPTTEGLPELKDMEEGLEENEQSFSEETPDVVTENVDGSNENTETNFVKQEINTTVSELGKSDLKEEGDGPSSEEEQRRIKQEIMSPKTDTAEDSIQQQKDIKQEILSPDKDSSTDSVELESNTGPADKSIPKEEATDFSKEDKERETLSEVTEEPEEKMVLPESKEADPEKGASKPGEMEDEALVEGKAQNQENQEDEDGEKDMEAEGELVGKMEETKVQSEETLDDVTEEKDKEENTSFVEGTTLISESCEESKKEDDPDMEVSEVETMEVDEKKKKEERGVESGDTENKLEEKTGETKDQSEMDKQQETKEECENKATKEEEMEGQSHLTGNKSSAEGDVETMPSSDDVGEKMESGEKGCREAEGGESPRRSESTEERRGQSTNRSHQKSSPEEERSYSDGHHSSQHHGKRSHGNRDHRSPSYNQYDRPQEDRGWSRHDRHSHGDRDGNRHHGQNRHYHDNRHHYDRNRYDDGRHGHHDNRHGYHDNRHGYPDNRQGYHDNRSPRGHWRGHGGYRGGYRDYR